MSTYDKKSLRPPCATPTGLLECLIVCAALAGEAGLSPSTDIRLGASRSPTAFIRVCPTAGAALALSMVPILKRGRIDTELLADTTDSVGLPGLIGREGGRSDTFVTKRGGIVGVLSVIAALAKDRFDPFMDSRRLRRSSKGALAPPCSMLLTRARLYVSDTFLAISGALALEPRKIV